MTAPIQATDVQEYMSQHVVNVVKTMLAIRARYDGPVTQLNRAEHVSSCVSFGGEHIVGTVYVHCSSHFADLVARILLVRQIPEENDVNDALGEVTNMIAGGLKSWFCNAGVACGLSTPSIMRGAALRIAAGKDVQRVFLLFLCEHEPVFVDVHYKLN